MYDRNMDPEVGLDIGPKPKIWKVYRREKLGKGIKDDDMVD